jgi:signal transduction histidine kinase
MKIYRNYPIPVVLCDKAMHVYWSNAPAKSLFPRLTETSGLAGVLREFSITELLARVTEHGSCSLAGVVPLSSVELMFTPIHKEEDLVGLALTVFGERVRSAAPMTYLSSDTAQALGSSVRGSVHSMFTEMDALALKAEFSEASWVKTGLNRIVLDSYRILRVTSNLADYSQLQSGAIEPVFAAVDVCEHMDIIGDALLSMSKDIGIPLVMRRPTSYSVVHMDLRLIQVAILNLLHNSFYFTRPGNVVEFSIEVGEETSTVTVSDRGMGIRKEAMEHIWRPFYTGRGESAGVGLGLPLAKAIILLHHGSIQLHSELGKGTTVTFTIPSVQRLTTVQLSAPNTKFDARDRFSRLYTGLADAAGSPHGEE